MDVGSVRLVDQLSFPIGVGEDEARMSSNLKDVDEVIFRAIMDVYDNSERLAVRTYQHGELYAIVLIGGSELADDADTISLMEQIAADHARIVEMLRDSLSRIPKIAKARRDIRLN